MTDSLLAPLDTVIDRFPREPLYHVVHLRTLQILRRTTRSRRVRALAARRPA